MTHRPWPNREEWQADAERHVRHACYPRERVPDRLEHWIDGESRQHLAHVARAARLAAGRAARLLDGDPANVRLNSIDHEFSEVARFIRAWGEIQERVTAAAEQAVEDAITAEVARRRTDAAWERELQRRAQIDGEWVTVRSAT